MNDLFSANPKRNADYSAKDIEVLEGLEPVRRRPGMYIGGTDERAMHHLVAEVLDNAMDEAVAGHASRIEVELDADGSITVRDNGRGIPVDPHPKFPNKSALEVILTMLHSGGKFGGKVYKTSGGLHGVGISVVNALSDRLAVEVARDRQLFTPGLYPRQAQDQAEEGGRGRTGAAPSVRFHPDPEIFGQAQFKPDRCYRMARSKAYLFRGVEIRWCCDPVAPRQDDVPPAEPCSISPAASPISSRDPGGPRDRHHHALRRRGEAAGERAASNGRSPGRRTTRASSTPIATPCPRPRAAPMRPGCARA